jgi:hypothetical protein
MVLCGVFSLGGAVRTGHRPNWSKSSPILFVCGFRLGTPEFAKTWNTGHAPWIDLIRIGDYWWFIRA